MTRFDQSENGLRPGTPLDPVSAVSAIHNLITIQSDLAGRTQPVYYQVELMVDANGRFLLLNVHRRGTTRSALPSDGPATAAKRAAICTENSKLSEENCSLDSNQLVDDGIVIQRFKGMPGVILRAEKGFSRTEGGRLVLRYLKDTETETPEFIEFPISLQRVEGKWRVVSIQDPEQGPFQLMTLESNFAGMFATGIKSIQVGNLNKHFW